MTFTRQLTSIIGSYYINDTLVSHCSNSVLNLGFYPTLSLSPNIHIENICCKALKVLGFVKRVCSQLKFSIFLFIILWIRALITPIIEYGFIIWNLFSTSNSQQIEYVQYKFFNSVSYLCKIECPPHGNSPFAKLGLSSLADRR